MSLRVCKVCQGKVAATAKACPHCGAPQKPPTKTSSLIIAGLFALVVVSCVVSQKEVATQTDQRASAHAAAEAAKTPETRAKEAAEKAEAEAEFQFAVKAAKLVRASLKDPESFEFIRAGIVSNGALCMQYRAKNGFGAKVVEETAVLRSFLPGKWNKDCANKSLADMSRIRHAL